jgi:hypothetical protein
MRRGGSTALNAAQQLLNLQHNPICTGTGGVKAGELVWRFWARPTPLSRQYLIRITFREGRVPEAYVEEPNLKALAAGRKLPHVYSEVPVRLCLYLPGTGEWLAHMRIDQTTVPWVYLWLTYFEEWLWSDEWKGGGMHPGDLPSTRNERRRNGQGSRGVSIDLP